jgi:hypothetical protein
VVNRLLGPLVAVWDLLGPDTACSLRACSSCGHPVTRLRPSQAARAKKGRPAPCARRGCDGRLIRVGDLWTHPEVSQ